MDVQKITMDPERARELYKDYRKHLHYSTPVDHEIALAYKRIAQGKLVIKALESIVTAGVNTEGLPKLAIVRADAGLCRYHASHDGSAWMADSTARVNWGSNTSQSRVVRFAAGSFPECRRHDYEAIVPLIPIGHRPKRGLANYHILWEAEWSRKIPVDPYLLRRIGKGDMWLVVAMWDLSEVERAALAARL